MIKFFRRIRQNLLSENRFSKYLLYAIGEILLVVIGILIALNINNNNELRKQRVQELHYLKNIKTDLQLNIAHLDNYIATREKAINSANTIIAHYEGEPVTDLKAFSRLTVDIYTWRKFFQINNTFQELINSGNLASISNDSIKGTLLNMESLYKVMKDEEAHFRYDAEILLYEPSYDMMDMNPIVQNYMHHISNGAMGESRKLSEAQFGEMLKDTKQKNGFVMAVYQFTVMNQQFRQMKAMCQKLIDLIDKELKY
ncbi:DUF6090 family protein [Winogradskyella vincentii]|uniref:Type IV pili methyl-accepting chemotaxis transducer N-term n=1 Tax=Winogradskyella vincentii TaxID=2877122 RepID=A0ABS7Y3A3_9FLAO|nr:DUF6090 family protein [Winogradskyella vincentii]MCA0154399.1 hypothetical protein [Winogradskyella vincentii]